MKIRTLQEIEEDERVNGPLHLRNLPKPVKPPGPVKRAYSAFGRLLLGIGELLLLLPRLIIRLLDLGLGIAIILGIVGCIVFGLVYLFG